MQVKEVSKLPSLIAFRGVPISIHIGADAFCLFHSSDAFEMLSRELSTTAKLSLPLIAKAVVGSTS